MNLEMPSQAEADSLRTILLIVLGVMILTIPVVCVIVVAKVTAQRKQRPAPGVRTDSRDDAGSADSLWMAAGTHQVMQAHSANDESAPHSCRGVHHSAADDAEHHSSYSGSAPLETGGVSFSDEGGGSSDSGGSSGGGDSGGGSSD